MYTIPKFEIYDDEKEPEGVFNWGSARDELYKRYHNASESYYMGNDREARSILEKILNEDAHFIDAHILLGNIELEHGNFKKGTKHHRKAVEIGKQIIPESFDGRIRWGFTENRPFLTALSALAIDLLSEGELVKSIQLLEQLLSYNPDDNQGNRFLVGDLHFLTGNTGKAETYYKQNSEYPPYLYSYGLLQFSREKFFEATTLFRKAILSNIYISDLLRGKLPIIPYEIWHGSNFEMPEIAYPYLETMGPKWAEFPKALGLLQFIHLVEPSCSEIEEVFFLKNDLYYSDYEFGDQETSEFRNETLSEIDEILKGITDQTSKKIVRSWKSENAPFIPIDRK